MECHSRLTGRDGVTPRKRPALMTTVRRKRKKEFVDVYTHAHFNK